MRHLVIGETGTLGGREYKVRRESSFDIWYFLHNLHEPGWNHALISPIDRSVFRAFQLSTHYNQGGFPEFSTLKDMSWAVAFIESWHALRDRGLL